MSPGTATYVYCLVQREGAPTLGRAPRGPEGLGYPTALEVGGGLWLVVAEAPLAAYGDEALEGAMGDLDWVGRCALAHEAVVEHLLEAGEVVPMKLFTLFHSPERALEDVRARRGEIDAILAAIAGCAEWGLRLHRQARAPAAADEPELPAGGGAGTAFLLRKQQALERARRARAEAALRGEELLDRLRPFARELRRRSIEPEGAGTLVLDAVFLVERARSEAFRDQALGRTQALEDEGLRLTLTGPWPAYHFSVPREEGA